MERMLRLEVAKQKSLHAVWDVVIEKAMRRFGMINTSYFNKLVYNMSEDELQVYSRKNAPVDAYTVVCFDPKEHSWMTVWSTVLKSGEPGELWNQLELFASHFNRDTVLVSVDDNANVFYRLHRPDTGERAWIQILDNGAKIEHDCLERFMIKKQKKADKDIFLSGINSSFLNADAACSFIDSSLGFTPDGKITLNQLIEEYKFDNLCDPFSCMCFTLDLKYLSYDAKTEYKKVLSAVKELLLPLGFHKNNREDSYFRILENRKFKLILAFQKNRCMLDRKHNIDFTLNISFDYVENESKVSDFANTILTEKSENIRCIVKRKGLWYELNSDTDTQAVIGELLSDIRSVINTLGGKATALITVT